VLLFPPFFNSIKKAVPFPFPKREQGFPPFGREREKCKTRKHIFLPDLSLLNHSFKQAIKRRRRKEEKRKKERERKKREG
jgi:hypothetical protein